MIFDQDKGTGMATIIQLLDLHLSMPSMPIFGKTCSIQLHVIKLVGDICERLEGFSGYSKTPNQ